MKANKRLKFLAEGAADLGKLRSVLRDWGYEHHEIQRAACNQKVRRKR